MACGFFRTVGVAALSLAFTFIAAAQTPQPPSRFDITGYAVEGAPLLKAEDFSRLVSPYIGKQKTAADVQKARQAVQQAYLDLGHCSVQVTAPKTEPDAGVVTLKLERSTSPLTSDCLPMVVLDEKRATPATAVQPEAVAVRPFADVTGPAPEATPSAEPKPEVARAPLRPLQDRLSALQAPTGDAEFVAAPVAREEPAAGVSVEPLAQAPVQPGLVVTPVALAPVAVAEPKPAPVPAPNKVEAPVVLAAAEPEPAPAQPVKPEAAKPDAAPVVVPAPDAATQPGAPAESPTVAAAPLKFDIERFVVEGNTVLKPEVISKVLRPFGGKQKDFGDVQRALEALQVAYQDAGYGTVQVTLPEQELERGEVRFEVIETRVGKVDVQGNRYYTDSNIRRSVPNLKEGETPNSAAIARSLKIANENPTKQTQVSLRAGANDNEVDATVKVADDNPRKYSVTLDNTGTSTTGTYRIGFGFTNSNMWGLDHQLTVAYITNPEHPEKVTVFGAGYHVPIYPLGDSVDLIVGYSDVDSGTVQQIFNVSGAGLVVLGRYNHILKRIGDYEHKLTFGLDYKAFQNRVLTTGGAPLVPDITVHPLNVTYSGTLRKPQSEFSYYAGLWYNAFPGGNDGSQSDFSGPLPFFPTGARQNATAEYAIERYGASYTWLLSGDWLLRAVLNGQFTRNALIAPEQFGIGGWNSVRGFNERQYSMDKGYQKSVEIYTPDLAPKLGFTGGGRFKLVGFYDTASIARNFVQPGEQTGISADSVGLGFRMTSKDVFSLRFDYAQVLHDGGMDSSLPNGRRNSNKVHAAMTWTF